MTVYEKELEVMAQEDCMSYIYDRIVNMCKLPAEMKYPIYSLYFNYFADSEKKSAVDFEIFVAACICVLERKLIQHDLKKVIAIARCIIKDFYTFDEENIEKILKAMHENTNLDYITRNPFKLFDFLTDENDIVSFFDKYEMNDVFYTFNNTELMFLFLNERAGFVEKNKEIDEKINKVIK